MKLLRMIKFAKAVITAFYRCQKNLAPLGGWVVTYLGPCSEYSVSRGVVTEDRAYDSLLALHYDILKALREYRLDKKKEGKE